jgi:hypothetical protein
MREICLEILAHVAAGRSARREGEHKEKETMGAEAGTHGTRRHLC